MESSLREDSSKQKKSTTEFQLNNFLHFTIELVNLLTQLIMELTIMTGARQNLNIGCSVKTVSLVINGGERVFFQTAEMKSQEMQISANRPTHFLKACHGCS